VIEDAFTVPRRGVVLLPDFRVGATPNPIPATVELRRPDGTQLSAEVIFNTAQLELTIEALEAGADPIREIVLLPSITKADVPIGTEIWYEDESP
jgi:hypothetical protein